MKIQMNTPLKDMYDKEMEDKDGLVTLRRVVHMSLLTTFAGDDKLTAEQKVKFWNLASDAKNDEVDWTPEEVAIVRERIGKGYGPAVVGPAYTLMG